MNKEIIKEKEIINEYGVKERYELYKSYKITESGKEYNVEYCVHVYVVNSFSGYYRTYKRLENALKDSYVEKYLG